MNGLFGPSLPREGKSVWPSRDEWTPWTVTSRWRKVGLTWPQVDGIFGPSLPWKGMLTWLRLRLIGSSDRQLPGKESRADLTWDGTPLWTITAWPRPQTNWLIRPSLLCEECPPDLQWMNGLFWTVTSRERKVDLSSPEMDCLFGPSLLGEECRPDSALRWIGSFDCHFPVKESRPDSAWDGSTLWTVTSRRRRVNLTTT